MTYLFFKDFVFRTPLYSIDELQRVLSKERLEDTLDALFDFFSKPINKEALFLASPDLYNRLLDYQQGLIVDKNKVLPLAYSLLKYFQRMCTRCTPFGLFAGLSMGSLSSDSSKLTLCPEISNNRYTRLDMNYLCALAAAIAQIPEIRYELSYFPNTSLYVLGDQIRYIEYFYKNGQRIHQIASVEGTDPLQTIISLAENGSRFSDLINSITSEDISEIDAELFVNEIIDSQVLVSNLEPSMCGKDFLGQIIETLSTLPKIKNFIFNEQAYTLNSFILILKEIQECLKELDKARFNNISSYYKVIDKINSIGVAFDISKLFQTDLTRATFDNNLQSDIIDEINQTTLFLNKISPTTRNKRMEDFISSFYERYEDNEISLQLALDVESGIGYSQKNIPKNDNIVWSKFNSILLHKLLEAREKHSDEIILHEKEFNDSEFPVKSTPDTISFMVEVCKSNDRLIPIFSGGGGSSAGNLLSRFGNTNSKIKNLLNQIIEKEEELKSKDYILAEIIHLPEARTGNILLRPNLRKYEIPYLAKPSVTREYQIDLNDLYISIKNGNIYLRSKKLNKYIIPRLTNAHNFSGRALPLYHFLCDLQNQLLQSSIGFHWGPLEAVYQTLPRVKYNNTVISPATWILNKKDFDFLFNDVTNNTLFSKVRNWQQFWKMPSCITLCDYDNELLVDFNNELSIKCFLNTVKNRNQIKLTEYFFSDKNTLIKDTSGQSYTNEFIFIGYKNTIPNRINYPTEPIAIENVKRNFIIGDEWLYLKIYCGISTTDLVLKYAIEPLVKELINKELIDKWFFIRYADPQNHLRVRFKLKSHNSLADIIKLFNSSISYFRDNHLIWKVQSDTYNRELERYCPMAIEIAESIFNQNSNDVLQILQICEDNEQDILEQIKWYYGLKQIDSLLNSFNLNLQEKMIFISENATSYGREFGINNELKKTISNRFRTERRIINQIMSGDIEVGTNENNLAQMLSIISKSELLYKKLYKEITSVHNQQKLSVPISSLLSSYIHMFLNRLFNNNQRFQEMLQYNILWHYYRSEIAQIRK